MRIKRALVGLLIAVATLWMIGLVWMLYSDSRWKVADSHFRQGEYQEAAEIYESLLGREAGPVKRTLTQMKLARCRGVLEQHDKALVAYGDAINGLERMIDSGSCPFAPAEATSLLADLHRHRALSHAKLNNDSAARQDLLRADEIEADFQRRLEEFDRFERELDRAIKESPPEDVERAIRSIPDPY